MNNKKAIWWYIDIWCVMDVLSGYINLLLMMYHNYVVMDFVLWKLSICMNIPICLDSETLWWNLLRMLMGNGFGDVYGKWI